MKQKQLTIIITLLLLLMATTSVALAQETNDRVIETGETVSNDIALFGEDLIIQEGAVVEGDIASFGGNVTVAGTVTGDVVLFGGNMTVESTAVLDGDCALLGGKLDNQSESAQNCSAVEFGPEIMAVMPDISKIADNFNSEIAASGFEGPPPPVRSRNPFFGGLMETLGQTLVMSLIAFGAAALVPNHLSQVGDTIRRKPVASGGMGLLTGFSMTVLIGAVALVTAILTLVCIGLLGIPVVFMLGLGLAAATALGWVTLGDLLGQWLADRLQLQKRNRATTAVLGTAVLTFGVGILSAIPFMIGEWLITWILLSIGLGAATLTRFGSRPYPISAGYGMVVEQPIAEDPDKITSILETLPTEETADLKDN